MSELLWGLVLGGFFVYLFMQKQVPALAVLFHSSERKWYVQSRARKLAPSDREQIIALLLEEIDRIDDGTEYDVG